MPLTGIEVMVSAASSCSEPSPSEFGSGGRSGSLDKRAPIAER
jgi:hypothetical protein